MFTVPKWLRLLHVLFSLGCERVVTRDIELLKRFGYPDWFVKAWRAGAGNSAVNSAWMVHLIQLGIMRSSRLCIGGIKVVHD
jgi:hypothetical protein